MTVGRLYRDLLNSLGILIHGVTHTTRDNILESPTPGNRADSSKYGDARRVEVSDGNSDICRPHYLLPVFHMVGIHRIMDDFRDIESRQMPELCERHGWFRDYRRQYGPDAS